MYNYAVTTNSKVYMTLSLKAVPLTTRWLHSQNHQMKLLFPRLKTGTPKQAPDKPKHSFGRVISGGKTGVEPNRCFHKLMFMPNLQKRRTERPGPTTLLLRRVKFFSLSQFFQMMFLNISQDISQFFLT